MYFSDVKFLQDVVHQKLIKLVDFTELFNGGLYKTHDIVAVERTLKQMTDVETSS